MRRFPRLPSYGRRRGSGGRGPRGLLRGGGAIRLIVLVVLGLGSTFGLVSLRTPDRSSGAGRAEAITGPATVIDGKTLRINRRMVRLAGVDAPDRRQACTGAAAAPYPCGQQAAQVLTGLIGDQAVDCTAAKRDQNRRLVATCAIGASDLGEAMIRAGWALAEPRAAVAYQAAQATAEAAKAGLWATGFVESELRRQ